MASSAAGLLLLHINFVVRALATVALEMQLCGIPMSLLRGFVRALATVALEMQLCGIQCLGGWLHFGSQLDMTPFNGFYCKWVMPADNSALPFWCSVGFRFSPRSRQGSGGYQHQSTLNILLTASKQDRQK